MDSKTYIDSEGSCQVSKANFKISCKRITNKINQKLPLALKYIKHTSHFPNLSPMWRGIDEWEASRVNFTEITG